jgi:DNA ligase-1
MAGIVSFGVNFQLLTDYCGQDCDGFLMSEKMDGWRCGLFGGKLWTRGGIQLDAPEWFLAGLPDCALDGELFAGRGEFNSIQRRLRDGWHGLTFQVFDAPEIVAPFRKRLAFLKTLELPDHCRLVEHIRCRDTVHLLAFADAIVAAGGEGAVVRNPRAGYVHGRTDDVLRWCPQDPSINRPRVAA